VEIGAVAFALVSASTEHEVQQSANDHGQNGTNADPEKVP
jgi:hypothetical protein